MTGVALAEIFPQEAVAVAVAGEDRAVVVRELVGLLVRTGRIPATEEEAIVQWVLAREATGSSVFEGGIAVPSCRTSVTEEFVGAVGLCPKGLVYDAAGEPVHAIFLLAAPLDRRDQFFEVLGRLAALGTDKTQRLRLRGARTPDEVHGLLRELDRR